MLTRVKNNRGVGRVKAIAAVCLLSVFSVFILQNTEVVEITFLLWNIRLSRILILIGALFVGILIGLLVGRESRGQKNKQKTGKW